MNTTSEPCIGFIGLGNMGQPMAANIAKSGRSMVVFDAAGTAERAPEGAVVAASAAEVAAAADIVILSLPDGKVSRLVSEQILESNSRRTLTILDTSTIGIAGAQALQSDLAGQDLAYYDAPVSGGTAGAKAGTVAVMFAGPDAVYAELEPLFSSFGRPFHVGTAPGQGQAMKILNNFLSATSMTATSEAISFGEAQGLDMAMMLDVLNVSTGQNTATSDKFPKRILTEAYDAGFTNSLLFKDVKLYQEAVIAGGQPNLVGKAVVNSLGQFTKAEPGSDFTRIYPFVKGGKLKEG